MIIKKPEVVNRLVELLKRYMTKDYLLFFEPIEKGLRTYIIRKPENVEQMKKEDIIKKYTLLILELYDDGFVKLISKMGFKDRVILEEERVYIASATKATNYFLTKAHETLKGSNK